MGRVAVVARSGESVSALPFLARPHKAQPWGVRTRRHGTTRKGQGSAIKHLCLAASVGCKHLTGAAAAKMLHSAPLKGHFFDLGGPGPHVPLPRRNTCPANMQEEASRHVAPCTCPWNHMLNHVAQQPPSLWETHRQLPPAQGHPWQGFPAAGPLPHTPQAPIV